MNTSAETSEEYHPDLGWVWRLVDDDKEKDIPPAGKKVTTFYILLRSTCALALEENP